MIFFEQSQTFQKDSWEGNLFSFYCLKKHSMKESVETINSQNRCQEYAAVNLPFSVATRRSEPPLAPHNQFYSVLAPINNANNNRYNH